MSLKMFAFRVVNMTTKESCSFLGQGVTLAAAFADGLKGTQEAFRPKNDGRQRSQIGLSVRLPSRKFVIRDLVRFESDKPHDAVLEVRT